MPTLQAPPPPAGAQPIAMSAPPPPAGAEPIGQGGAVSDFLGGVGSKLNPLNMLQGMADTVKAGYDHPIDTALSVLAHPYNALKRAKEAMDAGKPEEAAVHIQSAFEPAGFATEESNVKTATAGKRAEGFGELIGSGLASLLGSKVPEVAEAAGPVVKAAAKAGGKDVAGGAVKATAGTVLVKGGGGLGESIGGYELAKSGVKQMSRGAKAAFQAGRDAYNNPTTGAKTAATPPPLPAQPPSLPATVSAPPATAPPEYLDARAAQRAAPPASAKIEPEPLDNTALIRAADARRGITPPPEAAPPSSPAPTPPPPAAPAAPAAAEPQISQIPATEHPGAVDFAARARAQRAEFAGPIADTLEKGGFTAELAKKLAPKDWLRLSKSDGIGVNIPPKLAKAVVDELDSRAAARDLAKTQQGTQAAADAGAAADAARRDTMIAPSDAYAEALKRPGALAAAKALADELGASEEQALIDARARRTAAAKQNPRKAEFDAAKAKR